MCAKNIFLVRFCRIHPVQSVVNNPTQLSGRGFGYLLYVLFCRNFTFCGTPKWKLGRVIGVFFVCGRGYFDFVLILKLWETTNFKKHNISKVPKNKKKNKISNLQIFKI